jgi:GNAT superfamily N-acetyltransferase
VAILAFGSVLLGAAFGRFFKIWVLVPACSVTFAIVFASSAYHGHGLLSALLQFAVIATCLQIGYASGLLSCVARDGWRRLKIPREIPRESSHPAATRQQQLF